MTTKSPTMTHLEQMQKLDRELAQQLQWLDRQGNHLNKAKLKTQPSTSTSYSSNSQKYLQFKPSVGSGKGYKVCQLKVAIQKPSIKQMGIKTQNKQNRTSNITQPSKTHNNDINKHQALNKKADIKSKGTNRILDESKKNPDARYLLQEFESSTLFPDYQIQQTNRQDTLLFDDDSMKMGSDSLNFQAKDIPQQQPSISHQQLFLYNNKQYSKPIQSKNFKTINQLQCTFKPTILQKSKKLAQKLQPSFDRLTARSKKHDTNRYKQSDKNIKTLSRQRLNSLSKPKLAILQTKRQQDDYPFRPILSRKSLKQFDHCSLDIVGRNQLWLQQKENKLMKLREQEEKMRIMKEVEAQQRVVTLPSSTYRGVRQTSLSKFNKQGLAGYFERLQHASQLKRRAEEAQLRYSGKGWNGSITKPKQFKLSGLQKDKKSNTNIKGVQKEYQKAVKQLHQKIQKLQI